jgi:hypothetical protein
VAESFGGGGVGGVGFPAPGVKGWPPRPEDGKTGSPSTPPAGSVQRTPRTEFVIMFIWQEPLPPEPSVTPQPQS